jgi:hypothetical protein
LSDRANAANGLRHALADYPLNPVLHIWEAGKDLIEADKPAQARHAGWELLTECAKHVSSTDLERKEYFQTLSAPANPEDFHLQLAALVDLTKQGRNLAGFDYEVFPLLTSWLQQAYRDVKAARKQFSLRGGKGVTSKGKAASSGQEKNFAQLFNFILDVIKCNFKVANDIAISNMISILLEICVNTNAEEDLKACIDAINAIVTFGSIPDENLAKCTKVLGSIFCLVGNLEKESWHAIANLCKSHHGHVMVQILLNVLHKYPSGSADVKDANREVRGALAVLKKLIGKTSAKGYPQVPLAVLTDGLETVAAKSPSPRVLAAVLKLVNALFDDGEGKLHSLVADEDWGRIFGVAGECSKKATLSVPADQNASRGRNGSSAGPVKDDYEKGEDVLTRELRLLVIRVQAIVGERRPDFAQRGDCVTLFTKVHQMLPDSAVQLVLDYFIEFRCCFPSDPQWEDNLFLVLTSFYSNKRRDTLVRIHALQAVTDVYNMLELVEDRVEERCMSDIVSRILSGLSEETDTLLLQDTVKFLVSVAISATNELFEAISEALRGILASDRLRSPISASSTQSSGTAKTAEEPEYYASQSPSNVVTRGFVQMFMLLMDTDADKANKTFATLVNIARNGNCETDARLTAMKLLLRLRADWENRVFVTHFTESEALAGHLYRTEASMARKLEEDAAQASRQHRSEQIAPRPSRGTSFGQGIPPERNQTLRAVASSKTLGRRYQQLWTYPDTDALPETPASRASPVLFSQTKTSSDVNSGGATVAKVAKLNMTSWVEAIAGLLHNGCDWELYSYLLVFLPLQLSNHGIFRDAIPALQYLRKLLCDQIRVSSYQEPPSSSGPRRPEVLMCLFQTLTMLLSYHRHFTKHDEDEIVGTFISGLADKTAVCCVHALSICCHELPQSMIKSLPTILHKMSMIITRQGVAMHILEFLAGLSRLRSLYSNFREEEYRVVFGICFRYLQTVRDSRRGSRLAQNGNGEHLPHMTKGATVPRPSAAEDLPQYVYALAYHVVTFWFLALKLPDRANFVGWIAVRICTDNDGKLIEEEHAQVTLDFMQRVAFSHGNDSAEDPRFRERSGGDVVERRWVVGSSIITIQQDTDSGWAQIIKRQPSGTSCFTIRENITLPSSHQDLGQTDEGAEGRLSLSASGLPSHLLVQLIASMPQAFDSTSRPIPLPEEDAVDRAIRTFDRSSSVDGHKVGVIYIGENQTDEIEILANVSGSGDYVRFLEGLGTLTRLRGATFNTQGLDRSTDMDGQFTFCWRDRVTEIVFHVTTQMPTDLDHDPSCVNKKRHIGNDFVNIIFNDSGLPFRFDTFPSDFNSVNIVISPESRASFVASREEKSDSGANEDSFYKVQVMSRPGFPEISPAAETKMVSLKALPDFVRLLALNASVFALVWSNRESGEHMSSWRNRLREINQLRKRYMPAKTHSSVPSPSPPPTSGPGVDRGIMQSSLSAETSSSRPGSSIRDSFSSLRRSSVATFLTTTSEQTSHRSSILSTTTTDNTEIIPPNGIDSLVESIDFSKWA